MGILLTLTRNLGLASTSLSTLIIRGLNNNPPSDMNAASSSTNNPLINQYSENMNKFDSSSIRSMMENQYLTEVLLPLDTMITTIENIRNQIRERDNLKLDFDARTRKLRDLKLAATTNRNTNDIQKIPKKETKLQKTAMALTTITNDIFQQFDKLELLRYSNESGGLIDMFNKYSYYQSEYFSQCYTICHQIPKTIGSLPLPNNLPIAPHYGTIGSLDDNRTTMPVMDISTVQSQPYSNIPIAEIDRSTMNTTGTMDDVVKSSKTTTTTSSSAGGWQPIYQSSAQQNVPLTMGQVTSQSSYPNHNNTSSSGSVRDIANRFQNLNTNNNNNNTNIPPLPPRK